MKNKEWKRNIKQRVETEHETQRAESGLVSISTESAL